jgi:hypothetical protein
MVKRLLRKAAVIAAVPSARVSIGKETFDSPYGRLPYFVHHYNETWRYERCVEVPIARAFIARRTGPGLEVGNVLSHYGRIHHRVVDKYERGRGVDNIDVLEIRSEPVDYVVAISTLEHVGWDEPERDPDKALVALDHLRRLLKPDGGALISFRLGHHPGLTKAAFDKMPVGWETFYEQDGHSWRPIDKAEARHRYDPCHHDLLWIAEMPALT